MVLDLSRPRQSVLKHRLNNAAQRVYGEFHLLGLDPAESAGLERAIEAMMDAVQDMDDPEAARAAGGGDHR